MATRTSRAGRGFSLAVLWILIASGSARAQSAPQPKTDSTPVYTICTLLVGVTAPNAEHQGVTASLSSSNLPALEAAQYAENLADLQEKLKATFRLERLEVVSSYADWMSPGREMILEEPGTNLKLVVTGEGATEAPPNTATVHRGDGTSYTTTLPLRKSAAYSLLLTSGDAILLKQPWSVVLSTRTVLARQVHLDGPIYFVVMAAPVPGTPMRTSIGIEAQAYRVSNPERIGAVMSGGVSGGTGGGQGQGQGSASGVGTGVASGAGRSTGGGRASGTGVASGAGTGLELRAPKKLYAPQPTLTAEARAAGLKGPVILSGTIDENGKVRDIKVLRGVDGLNEIAIAAFRRWQYELPSPEEGAQPRTITITVAFPFKDEPD